MGDWAWSIGFLPTQYQFAIPNTNRKIIVSLFQSQNSLVKLKILMTKKY